MACTVNTQRENAARQIEDLKGYLGGQMNGTEPLHAKIMHKASLTSLVIDGVALEWLSTNAH